MTVTRRRFTRAALAALATASLPRVSPGRSVARPRVVIVGGGPGGLGVARQLASAGIAEVTLVEASPRYTTCFSSNLHLAGLREFGDITHPSPERIAGATVVRDRALALDPAARRVRLASGTALDYDRLVVAPGIGFRLDDIEGYGAAAMERMPHAYDGGAQHQLLRAQLDAMRDGGLFVISAPKLPFRCPPSPYERASLVAWYFSRHKPRLKILILDAKDQHSKQALFQDAWARLYGDMVEWLPAMMTDGGVRAVDPQSMTLTAGDEVFTADVANVIPAQRAADFATAAGLADDSGWCPVNASDLRSTQVENVHVLGDAIDPGEVPKSAYAAGSQATVCAQAIIAWAADRDAPPARFASVCWSRVAQDAALKVSARYEVRGRDVHQTQASISTLDDSAEVRARNARDSDAWYEATVRGMFG